VRTFGVLTPYGVSTNVIGNGLTTVLNINILVKDKRIELFRQSRLAILRKIKRGVCHRTSQHKTPHLILPQRTHAHPPP